MKNLSFLIMAFLLISASCNNSKKAMEITSVYEGEEGRSVFFDTKKKNKNLLLSDNFSHFNILYRTADNR